MRYSVGLNNVGSYQVSGVPFLKTQSVLDGDLQEVDLNRVSKNVEVERSSSSTGDLFVGLGRSSFAQTSAINIAVDDFYKTSGTITLYPSHSVSFWLNTSNIPAGDPSVDANYTTVLQGGYNSDFIKLLRNENSLFIRHQNSTNSLGIQTNTGEIQNFSFDGWAHIVFSYDETQPPPSTGVDSEGNLRIYVNSEVAISVDNHKRKQAGWRVLRISNVNAGEYAGPYDEITFWSKALDVSDVEELYNSANYKDPTTHSAAANLRHWWAFEPDSGMVIFTPNPTAVDDLNIISDRMNNGVNLIYDSGSNTTTDGVSFVQGPTDWKALSTSKMMKLDSSFASINSDIKIKKIYLYADGGNAVAEVNVSLTTIPSSRLGALPG